ncbi:MAG: hypothetical protein J6U52_04465 [Alistipes sp.]|nr:hypothetical protein [Alistipes sp.]
MVKFFIIKDFGLYKVSEKGEKLQLFAQFSYGCVVFKEFRELNEVNVEHDKIAEHSRVLSGSLRLGFDLLRENNCIELHLILWRCRMRDRENLAGSAP